MRRGSLGPTLTVKRRAIHGRKRGKRLTVRQAREQARSRRALQASLVARSAPGLTSFVNPVMSDGRVIR